MRGSKSKEIRWCVSGYGRGRLASALDLLLKELQELVVGHAGLCAVLHHVLEEAVTHLAVLSATTWTDHLF